METIDEALARHRKEAKDLQNKITQRKKQATKKTRKGVNDECAALERDMKERQEAELTALRGDTSTTPDQEDDDSEAEAEDKVNHVADKLQEASISQPSQEEQTDGAPKQKRNRQKERLARRAAEQEEEAKKAEAEALLQPNWKKQERSGMVAAFNKHKLSEREIRADGHCLYSSIADQLTTLGIDIGVQNEAERTEALWYKPIRRKAAMYILEHKEDFEGFMDEPLIPYVSKIERTAEWGGHLELVALSRAYEVQISVIQDGNIETIEPGEYVTGPKKIWLAYYKHGYGLGEHYNSLRSVDVDAAAAEEKKDVDAA